MLTETIGGECPACEYNRVLFRFGSWGYYHYVACPKCGFAYGQNPDEEAYGEEVWEGILYDLKKTLENGGFEVSVKGIYDFAEAFDKDSLDQSVGTLYDFGDFELEKFTPNKPLETIKI